MKAKLSAAMMLLGFSIFCFGAQNANIKQVLGTDIDHDGKISQNSLEKGEDYILIKQNPPKLNEADAVFVTTKNGIYSSANEADLIAPNAVKNLWVAQVTPTGEIRPYTLANLGYNSIQIVSNSNGQKEIVLGKLNGQTDKIFVMNYKTKFLPLKSREEVENKKRIATENRNNKTSS